MEDQTAQGLKILLVEDDVLNQRMFCILFNRLGHTVDVAFNGEEGVTAVRQGQYDLVFMDIRMPIMDGLEAARRIRALEGECRNTPIIAMTASDLQHDELRSLSAGMNDHVAKPLDLKRIHEVLDAYKGGRYRGQALETGAGEPREEPLLDPQAALPVFDGDVLQYQKIMEEFLQGLPHRIRAIEIAFRFGRWKIAGNESHNLKGVAASLGARKLSKLAASLDKLATGHQKAEAESNLDELKKVATALAEQAMEIIKTSLSTGGG